MTAAGAHDVRLPGGLVLRNGEPRDLDQIADLLVRRGEEPDALDHRLVVEDPEAGWDDCAVVVDGDRVVSTATLLRESLRIGDVVLPSGQVELVATQDEYEGRGLVRALMAWAHARSADLGHVVQVMIGIPYFYRLFGYEYAIDIPSALERPVPGVAPDAGPDAGSDAGATPGATGVFRRAAEQDLPGITALHEVAQTTADVAAPHSPPRRRWLLAHEGSTTWVVERAGEVVATGRTTPPDEGVLLADAASLDPAAAADLLRGVAALAPGEPVRVVERPGTDASTVLTRAPRGAGTPAAPREVAEQYYVRLPDVAVVLDRLRPVLSQRLAGSGLDRDGRDLVLSTFRRHYRAPVRDGAVGPFAAGGPMQGPGAAGGAGVAPDQLPALLFGGLGITGLTRIRPDVYPGPDPELFAALFPPLRADLLTYYLPY